jgi:hypothetical protein
LAAVGALFADGGGPIGWAGGGGDALRAAARGPECRLGAAGAAAGAAGGAGLVSGFASGGPAGSGVMMLTAGIEAAEGKSYFDGTGAWAAGAAGAAGGAEAVV